MFYIDVSSQFLLQVLQSFHFFLKACKYVQNISLRLKVYLKVYVKDPETRQQIESIPIFIVFWLFLN